MEESPAFMSSYEPSPTEPPKQKPFYTIIKSNSVFDSDTKLIFESSKEV